MTTEGTLDRRHDLLFDIRRSRRYHLWRARFFHRFKVLRVVALVLSSLLVFSKLFGETGTVPIWTTYLSAIVVLLAIIELATELSDKERNHRSFARDFVNLERDLVAEGVVSDEQLNQFHARYLEIEATEPPIMRTLNELCYNEEVRAEYDPAEWAGHMLHIPWYRWPITVMYGLTLTLGR